MNLIYNAYSCSSYNIKYCVTVALVYRIVALRRGRQRRAYVHDRLRTWPWNTNESRQPVSQQTRRRRARRRRQKKRMLFRRSFGA